MRDALAAVGVLIGVFATAFIEDITQFIVSILHVPHFCAKCLALFFIILCCFALFFIFTRYLFLRKSPRYDTPKSFTCLTLTSFAKKIERKIPAMKSLVEDCWRELYYESEKKDRKNLHYHQLAINNLIYSKPMEWLFYQDEHLEWDKECVRIQRELREALLRISKVLGKTFCAPQTAIILAAYETDQMLKKIIQVREYLYGE